MENFKKKATILGSTAALALAMSTTSQAAFVLMPNGDFEAGGAGWGEFAAFGDGSTISYETTGGNPGGFGLASNVGGGWGGGFVQEDVAGGDVCTGAGGGAARCGLALADYGLSGGDSTTFMWDMKDFQGINGNTAIKLESWTATTYISDTGDINQDTTPNGTDWGTYLQNYTFDPLATHFKVVLVGVNSGDVGFDNLKIDATVVPVPAAVWLFGTGLLGLIGVARRKKAA